MVQAWLGETMNSRYGSVELVRERGLVQVRGVEYEELAKSWELSAEARWCIGWINHDKTVFRPKKRRHENLDEIRMNKAREWKASFHAWVGSDDDRRAKIEHADNRQFKGFVRPAEATTSGAMGRTRPRPSVLRGLRLRRLSTSPVLRWHHARFSHAQHSSSRFRRVRPPDEPRRGAAGPA
jgi:hypothetical protein